MPMTGHVAAVSPPRSPHRLPARGTTKFDVMSLDKAAAASRRSSAVTPMTFEERFNDKVNVDAIMSGSSVIGRYEARLMICQLRGIDINAVTFTDPGVLMLDGMDASDLPDFLSTADETIQDMLLDLEDDYMGGPGDTASAGTVQMTPGGEGITPLAPSSRASAKMDSLNLYTLPEISQVFEEYKNADTAEVRKEKRSEFFTMYQSLDALHKLTIPPDMRSLIESAIVLGPSQQDTILKSVSIPRMVRGTMTMDGEGSMGKVTGAGRFGKATSMYGETNASKADKQYDRAQTIQIAQNESKNLRQWISRNRQSAHVWFFCVGVYMVIFFTLQIWIDYAFAQIWRAISMQLLVCAGVVIVALEADTDYIRSTIQAKLFAYYQFLRDPWDRSVFYLFVSFLCFELFKVQYVLALLGGFMLLLLTIIRLLLINHCNERMIEFCGGMIDTDFARDKFDEFDADADGYLQKSDMPKVIGQTGYFCFKGWLFEVLFLCMDAQTNDGLVDVHEFVQYCARIEREYSLKAMKRLDRKAAGDDGVARNVA